ncbi:hypothetical protein QLS71_006825 [Mariniflexile litorale]|uniref:Phytanoyl-CoA dioxygenase PhyH n=1 Tax=Mariniflexile litorale TaxID=3045158 RepID=A0AAU7EJS8_9FLAO|nr:hypothetical protein [Mariniflexile sp. KMM 9835]MDQ8211339.1 hypothetical protein [Mariniflexile sp. KMM 9835]
MSYYYHRAKGIFYSKLSNTKLRSLVQSIVSKMILSKKLKGNYNFFKIEHLQKHKSELKETGITYLGKILDDQTIEEITNNIKNLKCHDTWCPELVEFYVNEVTDKTHTASFKREDLVKQKIIFEIANNASVLDIVKDYLGTTPTISNVNAWWSFGGRNKAQEAQNFHRDNDDIKFCKLFIYLTDVTEESGPHIYVRNSVYANKLRKIRRLTDDEVEHNFNKNDILTLVYPKGHAFLEDTYGIHKGMLPKSENRLLLQIQYSISPIGYIKYIPEPITHDTDYSNYINRLIIK